MAKKFRQVLPFDDKILSILQERFEYFKTRRRVFSASNIHPFQMGRKRRLSTPDRKKNPHRPSFTYGLFRELDIIFGFFSLSGFSSTHIESSYCNAHFVSDYLTIFIRR